MRGTKRGLALLTMVAAVLVGTTEVSAQWTWSLSGSAAWVPQGYGILAPRAAALSSNSPAEGGAVVFTPPALGIAFRNGRLVLQRGLTLAELDTLSVRYQALVGGVGGGSPRFVVLLDTEGNDGVWDHAVPVYVGSAPSWTDPTGGWRNSGNFVVTSEKRWDTSQVGGTFYDTFANAKALVGDAPITEIIFVVDGSWKFGEQTILVETIQINQYQFTGQFPFYLLVR